MGARVCEGVDGQRGPQDFVSLWQHRLAICWTTEAGTSRQSLIEIRLAWLGWLDTQAKPQATISQGTSAWLGLAYNGLAWLACRLEAKPGKSLAATIRLVGLRDNVSEVCLDSCQHTWHQQKGRTNRPGNTTINGADCAKNR